MAQGLLLQFDCRAHILQSVKVARIGGFVVWSSAYTRSTKRCGEYILVSVTGSNIDLPVRITELLYCLSCHKLHILGIVLILRPLYDAQIYECAESRSVQQSLENFIALF